MKKVLLAMLVAMASVVAVQASGTVGEYNARVNANTNYVNPNSGQVLDTTGTVYNVVDDLWARVSTDIAKGGANKEAINVRPTTTTVLPVVNSGVGTPQSVNLMGSSNTVQLTGAPGVKIDGSSNSVKTKNDDSTYYYYTSTSMAVYPNESDGITINGEAVSADIQVIGGSATWNTTWGGYNEAFGGYTRNSAFAVPASSPSAVTSALGANTTAYFTIGVRRLK